MELAARTNWDGMGGGVGGILCVLRGEEEEEEGDLHREKLCFYEMTPRCEMTIIERSCKPGTSPGLGV